MRNILLGLMTFMVLALPCQAGTIAQWDFNLASDTNAPAPSTGEGSASLVGGTTASFASGSPSDASTVNNAWSTASYPAQATDNKLRGVQFDVSTLGYQNITISWAQRLSPSASAYARLQYAANGSDFVDFDVIAITTSNTFQFQSHSLAAIAEANDNPNFAFRIVTEFESTSAGTANAQYLTTSSNAYSTAGTIRFDLVTVAGELISGGNVAPAISLIGNQSTIQDSPIADIPFTISDTETLPNDLLLSADSSNPALVATNDIVFNGGGANRSIRITPEAGQTGTATITITVTDQGGKFARASFDLTVLPANGLPMVLARWNFNTSNVLNSPLPSTGNGRALLVGGASGSFAAGSPSDSNGVNNAWSTASYPTQGTANKQRGVQFNVSTVGYQNITISWDQRLSPSASKYVRFQYSTNGTEFTDLGVAAVNTADTFQTQTNYLAGVPEVNDNPNFAFRIVTEFESTAVGTVNDQYITVSTGAYSTAGTIRFDLMTISGVLLPGGNSAPAIASIGNQTTREGQPTGAIPFMVGDRESPLDNLMLTGDSSNPSLVATNHIVFGGGGANRTVIVTPEAGQAGTARISILVTDEGGQFARTSFDLTVLPANGPPTVSKIGEQQTLLNAPVGPISFTVGDPESPAADLTVTGFSANKNLVPDGNFHFEADASGRNRTVTISPATNQIGLAVITLTVSDGTNASIITFPLLVVPASGVVFCEPFSYANGSITTNSAFHWSTHSGTSGQMRVTAGQLQVTSTQSEDVNARLIGAPYATNSGARLYARFSVNFTALPSNSGDFFAHFKDVGNANFRARLFAGTADAAMGRLRLGIANGAGSVKVQIPDDLSLNTTYTVVLRYEVTGGATTLWVNPTQEADSSVTALDAVSLISVVAFAFRETPGIGSMEIDDLRIGTSFGDAVTANREVRLQIQRVADDFQVSWPASLANYGLQFKTRLNSPTWLAAGGSPVVVGDKYVLVVTNTTSSGYFRLYQGCP